MYESPSAPASIGGVLDSGFKLFRACFSKVVGLSILASLVGQLPSIMLGGTVDENGLPEFGASLIIAFLITMLFSVIFYGAILGRIHSVHRGADLSLGDSFNLGFSCMIPLFFCMVLYALAIMVGSILLIVPGVILSVSLLFAPYILVIEREGIIVSLKKSHNLVWGYWWRTTALISIAAFIMMVAYVLLGIVAGIAIAVDPDPLAAATEFSLVQTVFAAVLGGLLTPLFYSLTLSAYYDLKLRRQGEDLADRINAEPATT